MQSEDLLPKLIYGLRQKDISSFEDIFLLTYRATLSDIEQYITEDELAYIILKETYVKMWNRSSSVPEKNLLRAWIRILIKESIKDLTDIEEPEVREFEDDVYLREDNKLEQKVLTILIDIEEKLGILAEEEKENSTVKFIKKILRVSFSVFITLIAGFILFNVYIVLKDTIGKEKIVKKIEKVNISEKKEKEIKVGWIDVGDSKQYIKYNGKFAEDEFLKIDDSIYYFDKDHILYKGLLRKGIYNYTFNKNGILTKIDTSIDLYSGENSFVKELSLAGYSQRSAMVIANSNEDVALWTYYLENLSSIKGSINLLRFRKEDGYLEEIDTNVSGFIVLSDNEICYCKDGQIKILDNNIIGKKIDKAYKISNVGNEYMLIDTFGEVVNEERNRSLDIDDRTYYFKGDKIKAVEPKHPNINGNTYSFKDGENKIYMNGSIYLEDGIAITAMTSVNEYIYYSTIVDNSKNISRSRINRINTNTGKRENISPEFNGSILTMYYYKDYSGIYVEYLPEAPLKVKGHIAILSPENDFLLIKDDNFRDVNRDDELLELVMIDDKGIYCYLDNCVVGENGDISILSKKAITINESVVSKIE